VTRALTVLISTHDRAALLEAALRHLNAARRPPGWAVDVLVVANACTDGTHDLLAQYEQDPGRAGDNGEALPLRWVAEPVPGKSHALNRAIPLLTSDLVAFVDDDHRVDAGYLDNICKASAIYPDADILCGRILPDWDGTEPAWVHDRGPYRIYPLPVPRYDLGDLPIAAPQETATPGGGNLVLRAGLFSRVGGFSTDFGPVGRELGGAEDKEWVWRAIGAGARIQYVPDIVQYHFVEANRLRLGYVMRKAYERTASAARLGGPEVRPGAVRAYMIRKVAGYGLAALTSVDADKRRFHLVRLAASLGEIKGNLQARKDGVLQSNP
jgi:GT2 family glycosyltransferase